MAIEITTADSTTITGIRNALNSAPLSGAVGWDSVYTTTGSNSAKWSQAYTNLVSNSAAYLSGADISLLAAASASWNSVYATTTANSANWGAVTGDVFGPVIATDNAIARYNLSTGKLLQNSLVTVSDVGAIIAPTAGSVIPFYYDDQASFPNPTIYHGAIVHSHADGRMYFAHNNTWNGLSNVTDPVNSNNVLVSSSNVILSACTITTYLSVGGIIYSSQINTVGTGTPTLSSGSDIQLDAVTRVTVSNTPFRLANLTSVQRDNITPLYGDMIYNTTTYKFQGYSHAGWVDLN